MWVPVSTIAALCVLFDVTDATRPDHELDLIFRGRSRSDWEDLWHKESYTRCREKLARHLYWACEKDVYRITRRSMEPNTMDQSYDESDLDNVGFPYMGAKNAKKLLRYRRGITKRSGSSITSECCTSSGCTWEEYAEYCPTNKRYTSHV